MKTYLLLTAVICIILVFLPLCSLTFQTENNKQNQKTTTDTSPDTVSVFIMSDNKAVDIEILDYLVGAVAAEMPASYETEALKAQAVACYSYMLWIKENSDNAEYDISNDTSTHQGYLTEDEMKEKWGDKYDRYKAKIEEAVSSVYGQYMTYNGEVILALFHAISPGKTQNSEEVWQSPLPYIKSKSAPGDSLSPNFDTAVTVPCKKIRDIFSVESDVKDSELINIFALSDNSFVKEIPLGKTTVSAGDIASKLGLKSPYFTADYKEGNYIFKVKGYGHGLGMSQYSADYMARQGSTYLEILNHFYSSIKIEGI